MNSINAFRFSSRKSRRRRKQRVGQTYGKSRHAENASLLYQIAVYRRERQDVEITARRSFGEAEMLRPSQSCSIMPILAECKLSSCNLTRVSSLFRFFLKGGTRPFLTVIAVFAKGSAVSLPLVWNERQAHQGKRERSPTSLFWGRSRQHPRGFCSSSTMQPVAPKDQPAVVSRPDGSCPRTV